MSLQAGDIIDGKYRIVRLLGEGGMGAVYEGENTRIKRKVAIKVLHAAVAAKADVVQRFEREAQAAGTIGSEHIVEVLDLGNLPTGDRFMVMEFLEGESLGDRIKRLKRLPANEVARTIHQLLEGLAAAHAAGIIHRDLKPDNVYLLANKGGQRDFVKVLDFGVSKFSALDADMSMTKTGAVMGTPFYMSPEQARGGKIDQRSDIYSVGVVAYQAVTGRVPFHAETFNELVFKIALESPEPAELVSPGLDPAFAAIIAKAMARDSAARYQTCKEFQAAVAQWMMMAPASPEGPSGTIPLAPGIGATPSFSGMVPNALGQSGGALGQSGNALGQSGGALGQSGNALGQSAQQLAVSQGGMAVTTPQTRSNGAMIAVGLVSVLLLGGGAFGAYRVFGAKPTPVPAAPVPTAAQTAAPPTPTATATATAAQPAPTAAETAAPTATATATGAVAAATPEPAAPAKVGGPWPPKGKAPGGGGKAAPSAAPTAAPKAGGGRAVSGDL